MSTYAQKRMRTKIWTQNVFETSAEFGLAARAHLWSLERTALPAKVLDGLILCSSHNSYARAVPQYTKGFARATKWLLEWSVKTTKVLGVRNVHSSHYLVARAVCQNSGFQNWKIELSNTIYVMTPIWISWLHLFNYVLIINCDMCHEINLRISIIFETYLLWFLFKIWNWWLKWFRNQNWLHV